MITSARVPIPMLATAGAVVLGCLGQTGCDAEPGAACAGEALFGRPNESTGLTDEQCQPRCRCGGTPWEAPAYGPSDVERLRAWQLLDPPASLTANPYQESAPAAPDPDAVCAVVVEAGDSQTYRVDTYASEEAARADGAMPTHFGACGLCSTLDDLAVYMEYPDLTQPVRQCGLDHLGDPAEEHIQCLVDLGFTYPCAQIWYYNTINTREHCARPCFAAVDQPYQRPDGSLNECLQCDEEHSGPVFKAVAGRTRRNTGLASALCRPCREVRPLVHDYSPGPGATSSGP